MAEVSASAVARSREPQADLRTQLLAQKTQLVSELAAAIDNQFNNLMMSVTSYAELELKKASPIARRSLEQVLSNAGRATHLVQKMLAFSRVRTTTPRFIQLNEVATGLTELLHQLLSDRIEIALELQPDLPKIKVDPVDLEELLLSLAIHARSAISGPGKFSLSTKFTQLHQTLANTGESVMIAVSHSGSTNDFKSAESAQELKMNLTLSAINGIVEQANGLIRISGNREHGTNFAIYFPVQTVEIQREPEEEIDTTISFAKTVLIVEDDDAVRIPAAEFLKMEGFKVLQAKTGPEAINIALQKRSPLDILVTDIVMPAMSGHEVAKELVEMHPALKVLYMSGDTSKEPESSASEDAVLQKPFRLDKLNAKIRMLLGE